MKGTRDHIDIIRRFSTADCAMVKVFMRACFFQCENQQTVACVGQHSGQRLDTNTEAATTTTTIIILQRRESKLSPAVDAMRMLFAGAACKGFVKAQPTELRVLEASEWEPGSKHEDMRGTMRTMDQLKLGLF